MLLKTINNDGLVQKIKQRFFTVQHCILSSRKQTGIAQRLFQIFYFIPTVCIFFQNDIFQIPAINDFFRLFLLSETHLTWKVPQLFVLILVTVVIATLIIATTVAFCLKRPTGIFCTLLYIYVEGIVFLVVPIVNLFVSQILKQQINPTTVIFKTLGILSAIVTLLICSIFLKFRISPLRKGNELWNFVNQYEFNRFLLNYFRSIVFSIDKLRFSSIMVSIAIELLIRGQINKILQKKCQILYQTSSNLVISIHISYLIAYGTNLNNFAFKVCIGLILISLIKGLYEYVCQFKKLLEFPICHSAASAFYEFYFRLSQKFQTNSMALYETNQNLYYTIFKQHKRKCEAKQCPFKQVCPMNKNILPQVQDFVSQILAKRNNLSPENELLEQLWKLQRGKKYKFRNLQYKTTIQNQFIIFTVEQNKNEREDLLQEDYETSQNDLQKYSTMFYDMLYQILYSFSVFYEQIMKPKPKIQSITRVGEQIRIKVEQIQKLYMDLLKKKKICFKVIQLYLQFENHFLKSSSVNFDLMKKITLIQKNINIYNIDDIYLPAMSVYSQTGIVQNLNMECITFLKYTRFQIKTKTMSEFCYPQFNVQKYFQLNDQQKQNTLIFIKKRTNEFVCASLQINSKFLNSKKFHVYVIQHKRKCQGVNYFLIDFNFELIKLVKDNEIIKQKRHPNVMNRLDWNQIFETYIKPHQRDIKKTKLVKIDMKEYDSIMMCTLNKTFNDQFSIITVKIIKSMKQGINQRRSVIVRSHHQNQKSYKIQKFGFHYDFLDQPFLSLRGVMHGQNQRKNKTFNNYMGIDALTGNIRTSIVQITQGQQKPWKNGIKTYRLHERDLYNIDLQDRQAYAQSFQGRGRGDRQGDENAKPLDCYIIALVISVSIVLTLLSIFLLLTLSTEMKNVQNQFIKSSEIDRFKMNFYRILAMLRDVASGLYQSVGRDWREDVLDSYNNIRSHSNKLMFSNRQKQISYNDYHYTGNLNQLIDVILSSVYLLTQQLESELIQRIHDTSILQLTDLIQNQQDQLSQAIVQSLSNMTKLKNWLLFGISLGIGIFYILMLWLCSNLVSAMKHNLFDLMLISDKEAHSNQQNANKLVYAIDMIKKNSQIDIQNLLTPKRRFAPRKKQKQTVIGYQLKLFAFIGAIACFIVNITLILCFLMIIDQKFQSFKVMKTQGQDLVGVYTDLCKETNNIDHTGILNLDVISDLREQLVNIQKFRTKLIFTDQTNSLIKTYFFEESCAIINQKEYFLNVGNITCQKSTPNYEIQNPFNIGLDLYLTRAHYNIVNNMEQTFAATGIYSFSFNKVFSQLSTKISKDEADKLDDFIFTSGVWSSLLLVINIMYCLTAIFLSLYVKRKNESVQKLIKFLDIRKQQTKKIRKELPKRQNMEIRSKKRLSALQRFVD